MSFTDKLNAPFSRSEPVSPFASEKKIKDYLEGVKSGSLKMGLSTGSEVLDKYFRLKKGKFLIINGHDNVGKSTVIWYMALISAMLHDWIWIIFSSENEEGEVISQLIEFHAGERIDRIPKTVYDTSFDFVMKHFKVVSIDKTYTAIEILNIAEMECKMSKIDGLMIDPYNSLEPDYSMIKRTENQHNYDYKIAGRFRLFGKNNNIYVVLNCHAATEALRKVDADGYPIAPGKADTEGGGKFANRADDFVTIHRLVQHPEYFNETQWHQRKVKQTKTGGKPTPIKEPVIFRMLPGGYSFEINSVDIIKEIKNNRHGRNEVIKSIPRDSIDFSEPKSADPAPF